MLFHNLRIIMGLLFITAPIFSLTHHSAEAQTIPIPEFKPKSPESQGPPPTDFAMKVQLQPHENKTLADLGYYQVSDFALAVSNSSDLCPTPITIPTCEFDLEGGESIVGFALGERYLSGMLNVDTGASTKSMLLHAEWQPVQEREQNGQTVQVINGTLDAGSDLSVAYPDYQSQINGTLVSNGKYLILEAHGVQQFQVIRN